MKSRVFLFLLISANMSGVSFGLRHEIPSSSSGGCHGSSDGVFVKSNPSSKKEDKQQGESDESQEGFLNKLSKVLLCAIPLPGLSALISACETRSE